MLLHGIIGALLVGIPFLVILIHHDLDSKDLRKQVSYYQKQEEASRYLTVWTLNKNIHAGDEITRAVLTKQQIRVSDTSGISSITDDAQLIGKTAKTALAEGTILQADFLYDGKLCTDDVRIKEITSIRLPEGIKKNEYIDIRIGYPDGEDYIIVKHKKVLELLQDLEEGLITGISLELSEEEQLRLSAAGIDVNTYENTSIYAIQYREDFQQAAIVDYPVNEAVFELLDWDPNVIDRMIFAGERKKRRILEKHLDAFLSNSGSSMQAGSSENTKEPSDITVQADQSELEIFE